MVGPQAVKAAKERMERERERSQRRRDVAKLTVTSYYEERTRIRRLDEQVALLKAVDEALRDSDYWRTTGFFSSVRGDNYYDHWLCLAIKEWAASHEPDGSQQWESALMAVAVESATRRGCGTGASATGFRRIGALATLRWLLPSLSFKPIPGSLDPDPFLGVQQRAAAGYCVCGCVLEPFEPLSQEDLALGGPPTDECNTPASGLVPFCRVHGRRKRYRLPDRLIQKMQEYNVARQRRQDLSMFGVLPQF